MNLDAYIERNPHVNGGTYRFCAFKGRQLAPELVMEHESLEMLRVCIPYRVLRDIEPRTLDRIILGLN